MTFRSSARGASRYLPYVELFLATGKTVVHPHKLLSSTPSIGGGNSVLPSKDRMKEVLMMASTSDGCALVNSRDLGLVQPHYVRLMRDSHSGSTTRHLMVVNKTLRLSCFRSPDLRPLSLENHRLSSWNHSPHPRSNFVSALYRSPSTPTNCACVPKQLQWHDLGLFQPSPLRRS